MISLFIRKNFGKSDLEKTNNECYEKKCAHWLPGFFKNFSVVFGLEKIPKDTTFLPQNIEKKIIYETYFMIHT